MVCRECGTENRADRKFCKECGTALDATCAACGSGNDPGDKFCGNCGTSLATTPAPVASSPNVEPARAEQRFISVLFADMVGFTSISEAHDSEDIRDLLTVYFERAREIIERFGGVVDKFIGDAVMGIWGAAAAREDDAQRAVRAALELVDMVGALGVEMNIPGLALRAGVNSGTTSVAPGGNEKGLVVGDLVNVASRLESLATPGTVNVGPGTEAVTNRAIDYEFLGEQTLKGKVETVPAWRALRVASMVGGRAEDEIRHPPFVGRDNELRMLKDALSGIETDQRARLVSVIGEAGIGKSRLAEEFRNHIDGYTETIYWHWGRSPSYGEGVTFWALGEMVRRRAGIVEDEEPARSRTRLRTTIAEFVPSEDDRQWIEPRLAGLLGLAEMPAGTRAELFAALRSFFQHIAAQGPAVMVFEDLHWADPGLLDFIGELVERSTRSPILVVTLSRPDLLEHHPAWGTQHRSSMAVRLSPLVDSEMRSMLQQYLPGVGDEVVDRIADRAAGFPLYAVELVRMLTAAGDLRAANGEWVFEGDAAELALPETLQTVIGARLDRLDATAYSLLQDGAILGQTFTLDSIARLRDEDATGCEAALLPLIHLELLELEDDPRSPERGQYRFVQSLIHEVAYQRLNRDDRRAKHLAVAEYLSSREEPELAGVVAGHYMGAYEATPAGPEKDDMVLRAIDALTTAAARAEALHSYEQAVDLLEEAIELAPDEATRAELSIKVAYPASTNNEPERAIEHLTGARAHFESTGHVDGVRRAATAMAATYNSHYQSDKALEAIRDVYEGLDKVDDLVSIQLAAEAARSFALTLHGPEAVTAADRLLPYAQEIEEIEIVLHTLISKATALGFMGRRIETYTLLRGAADEAEQRGILEAAGRALNNLGAIIQTRNPQEARRIIDRLGHVIARAQNLSWLVRHTADQVDDDISAGEYESALRRLDELEAEDLTEFWKQGAALHRARVELRTTGDRAAFDRGWAAATYFDGSADPQLRTGFDIFKADLQTDMGAWEEVYQLGMGIDPDVNFAGMWYAAIGAAWLGDIDKIDAVLEAMAESSNDFPRATDYATAIKTALQGDTESAAASFVDILDDWAVRVLPDNLAEAQVAFAKVVGLSNPAARQAAEAALEWIDRTGTESRRAVWAAALPRAGEQAAAG